MIILLGLQTIYSQFFRVQSFHRETDRKTLTLFTLLSKYRNTFPFNQIHNCSTNIHITSTVRSKFNLKLEERTVLAQCRLCTRWFTFNTSYNLKTFKTNFPIIVYFDLYEINYSTSHFNIQRRFCKTRFHLNSVITIFK